MNLKEKGKDIVIYATSINQHLFDTSGAFTILHFFL
jgi:hypothetical protein